MYKVLNSSTAPSFYKLLTNFTYKVSEKIGEPMKKKLKVWLLLFFMTISIAALFTKPITNPGYDIQTWEIK